MISDKVTMTLATKSDLDFIIEILEEAGKWLSSIGVDSPWQMRGYFPRADFENRISHGEVYVIRFSNQPAGTITLQESDEVFWGDMPPDTIYIHRFAVKRSFSGNGIGTKVLEWAEGFARSKNKDFLRLDCLATNPEIRRYYEKAGFVYVRDVPRFRWMASLYEKKLD